MSKTLVWFTVWPSIWNIAHTHTHTYMAVLTKRWQNAPLLLLQKSVTLYVNLWVRPLFVLQFALEPCMCNVAFAMECKSFCLYGFLYSFQDPLKIHVFISFIFLHKRRKLVTQIVPSFGSQYFTLSIALPENFNTCNCGVYCWCFVLPTAEPECYLVTCR